MNKKTQEDFRAWSKEYLLAIHALLCRKGDQYSKKETYALSNFREAAKQWGSTEAYQIMQYATKHWTLLIDKVQTGRFYDLSPLEQRQIEESARDMIIYMSCLIYSQLSDDMGKVVEETEILRG